MDCKYNIPFNPIEGGMSKEGIFYKDELKNPTVITKNHKSNIDCIHQISSIVVELKNQLLNDS